MVLAAAAATLAILPSSASAAVAAKALATAAGDVPATTSSFYVYGSYIDVCGLTATTECPLYDAGAGESVVPSGGMTILDLGAPCFEPATLAWGVQMFNSQSCTPDATLVILAQAWLRGYQVNPSHPASGPYVLVVGTSNSLTAAVPGYALTGAQMARHGQAWFDEVVRPIAAAAQALAAPVTIWAGDDIEESADGNWYDGATTAAWVDAYAAASKASKPCVSSRSGLMVDYGDYVPNEPGWSPDAVYHVAWQAAPACPVPEIYLAANALEWQSLNGYALDAGLPRMVFTGVLSQDGAAGTLSGTASWNTLRNATGQGAPFLSVIGVTGAIAAEVPDPPMTVTGSPGPGLVTIGWSAPAWDGGAAVTAYTVTVYSGSTVAQVVTTTGSPAPESIIIGNLVNGSSYTFYVSATNRVGNGPQSLPSGTIAPSALFPMR